MDTVAMDSDSRQVWKTAFASFFKNVFSSHKNCSCIGALWSSVLRVWLMRACLM